MALRDREMRFVALEERGKEYGASETAQGAVDCVESLLRLQVRSLFLPGSFQNAPNRTETCRAANQCQIACA